MLNEFPIDSTLYNTLFVKDKISLSIEIIMTAIFLIICISTWKYNKIENIPQLEYLIISIATLLSICLLITVEEMFAFYLILEFQSITLYVLASLKKNKHSIEAAIKYLIMGSFASILFLLGFSFIYSVSGLTHFEDLLFFLQNQKEDSQIDQYICYGLLFMSIGLFFKTYIVPMHLWVSDIYELAPTSSVMIFATTSALPYYFIFYKMYGILFANYQWFWKPLLIVVCVSSIVIGTVGALYQYSIKRLIAYSSITNTGYMFLSLILYESPLLITNAFFYIILYTLNLLGLFTLLNHLYYKETNGHSYFIQNIYQLNGLYDKNKILSLFFMIYFYTLAGLPPFSFFLQKYTCLHH
jgi:NADH:ubiquinone oxidoreductase subunit 2 (chain N)